MISTDDYTPDVIVVGGGLAGICAAIEAAENGASVTVLDRAYGGGATAISAGVIYAGGGTKQQVEAGYGDDTPENMYRYLQHEVGDAVDDDTLRKFCKDSVPNMEWLESHGARFEGTLCPFKTSLPKPRYNLYFSGNEKAYPMANIAKPAPRGHRPVGNDSRGMGMTGSDLWQAVCNSALRLGVNFQRACRVQEILTSDDGRTTGVRYYTLASSPWWAVKMHKWLSQTSMTYQATFQPLSKILDWLADLVFWQFACELVLQSPAIILAAGGFIMNKTMTQRFAPWAQKTATLGTAGDDGSGIQLGQNVGGTVSHMDRISAWRLLYPPEALLEGIIVSRDGERIAAEDLYGGNFADAMIDRANGQGFLILDSKQWNKVKRQMSDQTHSMWRFFISFIVFWAYQWATTLDGLARKLEVNSSALEKTVEAYNTAIVEGAPDPMRKLSYRSTILTAPFYGIDVSLRNSGPLMVPALTLGGLRVNGTSGLVLDKADLGILGLYAAGRNAVGVCSNNYISGLSLADCVFSGRRAGNHASRGKTSLGEMH